MFPIPSLQFRSRHSLQRAFAVSAIATGSLFFNLVPGVTELPGRFRFQSAAYAQSVSAEEVTKYARAVLAMEPLRQGSYNDIKRIVGSGQVPNILCHDPSSFSSLPGNARQIAVNYCNRSRDLVRNILPIESFNRITQQVSSDANLRRRIQNAMIELQQ